MKRIILSGICMLFASGVFTAAAAQNKAQLHTEILGIGSVLTGDDFEDTKTGYGGLLLIGPKIGNFALLGTGTFRRYGSDAESIDHANVYGFGVAPRYTFPLQNEIVKPWVGAMGSVIFTDVSMVDQEGASTTSYSVGGGVGVGFQLSDQVVLNTCASLGYMQSGDLEQAGVTLPDTDRNTAEFLFGLGLTIVP